MHGVMFFQAVGAASALLIVAFTGLVGWCIGYMNEKKSDGSILPEWGLHALANISAALISMFALV